MSSSDSQGWSIDELAQLVGVPSRTIREYRTQGLLPPPAKQGRLGVYDESHRRRLELIGRMQQRGYSLAGMRDLFDAWDRGESLEDVIGDTGLDEATSTLTADQLAAQIPALGAPEALDAAVDAGLIHRAGDGRWHVRAPSLLALIDDAVAAGLPLGEALRTASVMRQGARLQAEQLATMLVTELWDRSERAELERLTRRGRVLVARAAAALLVDELGMALRRRAPSVGSGKLESLIDTVRIGTAHHDPTRDTEDPR